MKIRAKFKVDEVVDRVDGKVVRMTPVTAGSSENELFFKYTPFGNLELGYINTNIIMSPGQEYYLDFILSE